MAQCLSRMEKGWGLFLVYVQLSWKLYVCECVFEKVRVPAGKRILLSCLTKKIQWISLKGMGEVQETPKRRSP